mmetsp:Transcript_19460/g.53513  ORF Transcript_19460/g.53513 Transcript_19460/m.53513 type:complete len:101 (-) Transcript_19460:507-809(-)
MEDVIIFKTVPIKPFSSNAVPNRQDDFVVAPGQEQNTINKTQWRTDSDSIRIPSTAIMQRLLGLNPTCGYYKEGLLNHCQCCINCETRAPPTTGHRTFSL